MIREWSDVPGDAQIVISNPDLEALIVRVLKAVDSPVDVRSLRSFVMSRLPVMDIYLVPIGGDDGTDEDHQWNMIRLIRARMPNKICFVVKRKLLRSATSRISLQFEQVGSRQSQTISTYGQRFVALLFELEQRNATGSCGNAGSLGFTCFRLPAKNRNTSAAAFLQGVGEARQFEQALKRKVREIITENEDEKVIA